MDPLATSRIRQDSPVERCKLRTLARGLVLTPYGCNRTQLAKFYCAEFTQYRTQVREFECRIQTTAPSSSDPRDEGYV